MTKLSIALAALRKFADGPVDDPSGDDPESNNSGDTFEWALKCGDYYTAVAARRAIKEIESCPN